ncbi:hypothetical protein F935_02704 [Acinetobacter calcoaceticus ANC 3811]|uniref:Lipoprotein n=1 Tax=Acinetobacter calcoaceticus ANC 3811 TaxID=1217690 RepID=R8Y346_ACICA|nr:hypothetical protein [Acinetobacter calcoaceticus]EOQ61932.1 hypothetical protein F935_02704 [Acinetobacter calcoaceticus ANC 3811]
MKSTPLCLGFTFCILFSSIACAKPCEIPVQTMNVAGLRVGQNIREFQKLHPTVKQVVLGGNNYQLEFADGVDPQIKKAGVSWVNHIAYDLDTEVINSFSLSFLDGPMASYETDLDLFKNRILNTFKVPQKGWVQKNNKYIYQCDDYRIEIHQDYGAAHTAIGPTVMVFSKKSKIF